MIGVTIYKNKEVIKSKIDIKYVKYKIFTYIFVGAVAILTGLVQFFDKNLGNTFTRIFFIVVIISISLDFILKRVYK